MLGSPVIKACRDLGIQIKSCVLSSVNNKKQQRSLITASQHLQHVNKVPAHRECLILFRVMKFRRLAIAHICFQSVVQNTNLQYIF